MGRGEGPLSTHLGRRPTPHNNRCRLYADDPVDEDDDNYGAAILCTEFADLPIPMPGSVQVITDGKGVPLAIRLDDEGKWVRKVDVPQDWLGICQFSRDLETMASGMMGLTVGADVGGRQR